MSSDTHRRRWAVSHGIAGFGATCAIFSVRPSGHARGLGEIERLAVAQVRVRRVAGEEAGELRIGGQAGRPRRAWRPGSGRW
jgi:hypothetical protein